MSKKDPAQPDPIGDTVGADIDKLLDRTSALAAKAGRQVGVPTSKPAPKASSPAEPAKTEAAANDIDAQIAELESMLQDAVAPARQAEPPEQEAISKPTTAAVEQQPEPAAQRRPTPQAHIDGGPPQAAVTEPSLPAETDDFDVSVDLSDHTKVAEQEIAERLTDPVPAAPAYEPNDESDRPTVIGRVVGTPLRLLAEVIIVLDRPFAGLSDQTKQLIGYVAIATLVMAVGGLVFESLSPR